MSLRRPVRQVTNDRSIWDVCAESAQRFSEEDIATTDRAAALADAAALAQQAEAGRQR